MPEVFSKIDIKIYIATAVVIFSALAAAGINIKLASAASVERNTALIRENKELYEKQVVRAVNLNVKFYALRQQQAVTETNIQFIKEDLKSIRRSQAIILNRLDKILSERN